MNDSLSIKLTRVKIDLARLWRKTAHGWQAYLYDAYPQRFSHIILAKNDSHVYEKAFERIQKGRYHTAKIVRIALSDLKAPELQTTIAVLQNFPDFNLDEIAKKQPDFIFNGATPCAVAPNGAVYARPETEALYEDDIDYQVRRLCLQGQNTDPLWLLFLAQIAFSAPPPVEDQNDTPEA